MRNGIDLGKDLVQGIRQGDTRHRPIGVAVRGRLREKAEECIKLPGRCLMAGFVGVTAPSRSAVLGRAFPFPRRP
jgi:hypothetical protein